MTRWFLKVKVQWCTTTVTSHTAGEAHAHWLPRTSNASTSTQSVLSSRMCAQWTEESGIVCRLPWGVVLSTFYIYDVNLLLGLLFNIWGKSVPINITLYVLEIISLVYSEWIYLIFWDLELYCKNDTNRVISCSWARDLSTN